MFDGGDDHPVKTHSSTAFADELWFRVFDSVTPNTLGN
jgi:hypothetical protein